VARVDTGDVVFGRLRRRRWLVVSCLVTVDVIGTEVPLRQAPRFRVMTLVQPSFQGPRGDRDTQYAPQPARLPLRLGVWRRFVNGEAEASA